MFSNCKSNLTKIRAGNQLHIYGLPKPNRSNNLIESREYIRETSYDIRKLNKILIERTQLLTDEQRIVFLKIKNSVEMEKGVGTGKTFLINLLLSFVRSYIIRWRANCSLCIPVTTKLNT